MSHAALVRKGNTDTIRFGSYAGKHDLRPRVDLLNWRRGMIVSRRQPDFPEPLLIREQNLVAQPILRTGFGTEWPKTLRYCDFRGAGFCRGLIRKASGLNTFRDPP